MNEKQMQGSAYIDQFWSAADHICTSADHLLWIPTTATVRKLASRALAALELWPHLLEVSVCTRARTYTYFSAYDKESNLPGHFKAFWRIISTPSNVKHVLAKWKREDIFMKWPETVRCQTVILSTVFSTYRALVLHCRAAWRRLWERIRETVKLGNSSL